MHIRGKLFGIRFVPGGNPDGCFELYVEDDGLYALKFTANNFWLDDLITVAQSALIEKFDPINVLTRKENPG